MADISKITIPDGTTYNIKDASVPSKLSGFTDDLGSSPTHTHGQYVTTSVLESQESIWLASATAAAQALDENLSTEIAKKGTYSKPSSGIPKTDLASAVQTSLGKADTALQSYTETDPTVPSWAKAASKPTYTASEVGALPDTTVIPSLNVLVITEDMVTVAKDATKGVSPYSTSYGYTNITVNGLTESDLKEGLMILPAVKSTMIVASANRNVRIRFGSTGNWHAVMGTTSILTGSSYFTTTNYRLYCYRTNIRTEGAFHLFSDSNTTYSAMTAAEAATGTATTSRCITAKVLSDYVASKIPDISGKQNSSSLETDVKAFIDKTYIESLLTDGDGVSY